MNSLRKLRQQLKRSRLALPPNERAAASTQALARIRHLRQFSRAQHIAAYVGNAGELDPMPLLMLAARLGKTCYLPVLHPILEGRLWFTRWQPGDPLRTNRFGIAEPSQHRGKVRPARQLDLVIVPLLGFDTSGRRLGMGGGYYDRTFAFVRRATHFRRPFLLGLAFESQQVDGLTSRPWDVTLDAVVTDLHHYTATPRS